MLLEFVGCRQRGDGVEKLSEDVAGSVDDELRWFCSVNSPTDLAGTERPVAGKLYNAWSQLFAYSGT